MTDKFYRVFILTLILSVCLSACAKNPDKSQNEWQRIVDSSAETEVHLAYHSDRDFDLWINETLVPYVKEKNSIDLKCEKIELSRIENSFKELDKEPENAANTKCDYDIVIVSAEEVPRLIKSGSLYGPFSSKIPNFSEYFSKQDYACTHVGTESIEGMAIPFYQTQLSFFYNADLMFEIPQNFDEFKKYIMENPNSFIYPSPSTLEGKLFVQSVLLGFEDEAKFREGGLSRTDIKALAKDTVEFFEGLNKYIYAKGRFLTTEMYKLDELFLNEIVQVSMSANHFHAEEKSVDLEYPDYTKEFLPMDISVAQTEYYAVIPKNSANKSGAMCVINNFLDLDMQVAMFDDKNLHSSILYSPSAMDEELKGKIEALSKKKNVASPTRLVEIKKNAIPEEYWRMILEEWHKIMR